MGLYRTSRSIIFAFRFVPHPFSYDGHTVSPVIVAGGLPDLADHHPIRIGDEKGRLVAASPVMTTSWGPS
jgi:hypothetical protein